jgi:hypothetical protein
MVHAQTFLEAPAGFEGAVCGFDSNIDVLGCRF